MLVRRRAVQIDAADELGPLGESLAQLAKFPSPWLSGQREAARAEGRARALTAYYPEAVYVPKVPGVEPVQP